MPPFKARSASEPGDDIVPVTKADADLPDGVCSALLVGTAGTANIVTAKGVTRNNVPLQEGLFPVRCIRVLTGGTASNIWAIY